MSLTPRLDRLDKNYFINGNFDFWQRGTSTSAPAIYLADRWLGSAGITSYSRQAGGPNARSAFFARIGGSSSTVLLTQRVESNFARQITASKMTVSFYAKVVSGSSDIQIRVHTPTVIDNYAVINEVFNATLGALTGSWQLFSYTFDVTSAMLSNGFQMNIGNLNASGAIQIDLSQIMLVEGENVADFNLAGRDYAEELMLCQRYYEKSYNLTTNPGSLTTVGANSLIRGVGQTGSSFMFQVRKRAIPTFTVWNPVTGNAGEIRDAGAPANRATTGGTASEIGIIDLGSSATGAGSGQIYQWAADAEI